MKKVPTIVLSVSYKGVKFIDATNKVRLPSRTEACPHGGVASSQQPGRMDISRGSNEGRRLPSLSASSLCYLTHLINSKNDNTRASWEISFIVEG